MPERVQAVVEVPSPKNVSQLRAFLGMVNYYHRFLPNLSQQLAPLHRLLQADVKWTWDKECSLAFGRVKRLMASETVLAHFNPSLPITLSCDASSYGLGVVLSHKYSDGSEHPVAYASRTLTAAEQKYSQIDKEALGVVWGVKRFHQYLNGTSFTLITDHQPLTTLFSPDRPMSATAASRLQRQALFLASYSYKIQYRNTAQHANADALSRLPLETPQPTWEEEDVETFVVKQIERLPLTASSLKQATSEDAQFQKSSCTCSRAGQQW